jgi:hypothetical protein
MYKRDDRAESRTFPVVKKFSGFLHGVYYITILNWAARRVRGRLRLGDALKLRYFIWLICLLLFVAAVDTIPDPPAINPPTGHRCVISSLNVRGPLTILKKGWFTGDSRPERVPLHSLLFRLVFDKEPVRICPLPRVHHAADTSPPSST